MNPTPGATTDSARPVSKVRWLASAVAGGVLLYAGVVVAVFAGELLRAVLDEVELSLNNEEF